MKIIEKILDTILDHSMLSAILFIPICMIICIIFGKQIATFIIMSCVFVAIVFFVYIFNKG